MANPYKVFDFAAFDAGRDCGCKHGFMLAARSLKTLSPASSHSIEGFVRMAREAHHRYLLRLRSRRGA